MAAHRFHVNARHGDIAVTDHGGSGHPVLLVHSIGGVAEQWTALCWELEPSFRPFTMDLRGHGSSASLHGHLDGIWQDIVDVIAACDVPELVIVAEELVCSSARRAAIERRNQVLGVLCINDPRTGGEARLRQLAEDTLAFTSDTELTRRMGMDATGPDATSREQYLDHMCSAASDWALDWYGGRRREVLDAMIQVNDDGSWLRRPRMEDIARGIMTLDVQAMTEIVTHPVPADLPVWYLDSTYPDRADADRAHTPLVEPQLGASRQLSIDAAGHPECSHPEDVAQLVMELYRAGVSAKKRRTSRA